MGKMVYVPKQQQDQPKFEVITKKEEKKKRFTKQVYLFSISPIMVTTCGASRTLEVIFGSNFKAEMMPIAVVGGAILSVAFVIGTYKDIQAINAKKAVKLNAIRLNTQRENKATQTKQEIVFSELKDYRQLLDKSCGNAMQED